MSSSEPTTENPVEDGRMPVKDRDEDKRPTGPMSPHTEPPDTDDGRPKGPMSPPPPDQS